MRGENMDMWMRPHNKEGYSSNGRGKTGCQEEKVTRIKTKLCFYIIQRR